MSKLCRPVEKITESIVGNINVKWSFGLAANDKRREGVVSPRASSHFAVLVQRDLRPLLFHRSYAGVFLLPLVRPAGIHPDLQHKKILNILSCLKIISFRSRNMSNPYLTVEKVTESLAGNIKLNWSLSLAANDTDREGVACTLRLFSFTFLVSNRN